MNTERRLDAALQAYRQHIAHQQRELYEFNVTDPCPCDVCDQKRFEDRTIVVLLWVLLGLGGVWAWWVS